MNPLILNSPVGIVGQGEMVEMLARSGQQLGYRAIVFNPEKMPTTFASQVDVAVVLPYSNIDIQQHKTLYPKMLTPQKNPNALGDRQTITVQVARSASGYVALSGLVENVYQAGVLRRSVFPARVSETVANSALSIARTLAEQEQLLGLVTVELSLNSEGQIAGVHVISGVHASGNLTLNGGGISQFEMCLRAACDLPILDFAPLLPCATVHIYGWELYEPEWDALLGIEGAHLYMYGTENNLGERLGHVNIVHFNPEVLFGSVRLCEMLLYGNTTL